MKKFFSIVAAMLLMVGAVSAKTIYCKAPAWWAAGTATGIYAWGGEGVEPNAAWPGVRMTAVQGEENTWSLDLDDKYTMLVFTRMNPSDEGDLYWGAKTEDLTIPADKDLYTITTAEQTWDPSKVAGEWSVYGSTPVDPGLPSVAVAGAFNGWSQTANVLAPAEDNLTASAKVTLGVEDYQFKMVLSGSNWVCPQAGLYEIKRDHNSVSHISYGGGTEDNFVLKCDAAGEYIFTWTYSDSTLTVTFPEKAEPVHANGFYLMGSHNEWAIDDAYLFAKNDKAQEGVDEYILEINLAENQVIKPAYVEDDATKYWYPAEGGDYTVDADHAGKVNVYFRPERNGEWGAFGGYIYIEVISGAGITHTAVEAKAVKTFMNGQLVILKGDKVFNAIGTQIQ